MGTILAKKPQHRVTAKDKHATVQKLEKLFEYMADLKLELSFYYDRIYVFDRDHPENKEWEIVDAKKRKEFLTELPCEQKEYKLSQDRDIPARQAQPAPANKKS